MFDKIKMRRGRQWYVNKGNEWFFDEKHANYAQTECQFRYCGTAIPFLTVRSTAR